MEFERTRAAELAERLVEIGPATCDVRIFADDDGVYKARLLVELSDPTEPFNIPDLIDQLTKLGELIEGEGLKVASSSSLRVTLTSRE